MKKMFLLALAVLALPRIAWGATEPSSLTNKAKAAFADITKAKTALDAGKQKTSSSYLSKAETLLKSVMGKTAASGSGEASPQAVGNAQEPAKSGNSLEALAGKTGLSGLEGKTGGLSGLEDTYQKVTLAHSLLKTGDSSKAKGILDQIPSSPADALKVIPGL
jgi:hypothetical protein